MAEFLCAKRITKFHKRLWFNYSEAHSIRKSPLLTFFMRTRTIVLPYVHTLYTLFLGWDKFESAVWSQLIEKHTRMQHKNLSDILFPTSSLIFVSCILYLNCWMFAMTLLAPWFDVFALVSVDKSWTKADLSLLKLTVACGLVKISGQLFWEDA